MLPASFLNNTHLILQPSPQLFHFEYSYFGFTACICGKSYLFSLHQEVCGVNAVTYIDKPYEISHQKKPKKTNRADKPIRTDTTDISSIIFPFLSSLVHNYRFCVIFNENSLIYARNRNSHIKVKTWINNFTSFSLRLSSQVHV